MATDGWFDGQGLDLQRDEFLDDHPGWQKYLADGVISASEIVEQETKIASMLKDLEPQLSEAVHSALTRILLEYEVLINMALIHAPSLVEEQTYRSLGTSR